MAFDKSAISTWNNEIADKAEWILKPILGGYGQKYITSKYFGIQGNNVKLPNLETDILAQSGYGCGFTTSGTTTITQTTVTTVPFTIQESVCLRDLHQIFTVQNLPAKSMLSSFDMVDLWVNRKIARATQKMNQAIWQGRTNQTNDTWLKLFNGFIQTIDNASDEVIVTGGEAGTAITTSNVRTIFEEALFNSTTGVFAKPVILQNNPITFCGQDTFATLRLKLMQDNLFHVPIGTADSADTTYKSWEMFYPGSAIKIVGIPELNATNPVETGSMLAQMKNRIVVTYQDNLIVAMNGESDLTDFTLWYSQDNDQMRLSIRGFVGVAIKHTDLVVTY